MILINQNKLGKIYVSVELINKMLKFNLEKIAKIKKISTGIKNSNYFFDIVVIKSSLKNNNQSWSINDKIFTTTKKILINNFNFIPKNISIIYKD